MAFRPVIPIRSVSYAPHQAEGMTRRDFMKWMAASVALGSAACSGPPQERIYPYVNMPEGIVPGDPIYYATQWVRDGYAQGILVSTQMGRPVKVEGNPNHPANFGGTDIFAQASVLQLWDPDRSQSVMQGGARLSDKLSASPSTWSAFEAAWRERAQQFAPRKGEGLRILTGPLTSPTTLDALQRLLRRYPAARWHRHAPIEGGGSNALRIGDVPIQPIWHFDRAEVIVAFDCDPFSMSPAHLRHARDWSTSRKAGRPLRLFAIESQPGALGAVAQQRIALAPSETEALLGRVASRVAAGLGQLADRRAAKIGVADTTAQFEDLLVKALLDSPGRSLLMAGAHLSPDAQQRVHWLNHRLGNIGKTMDYIETPDASIRFARPLAELL
ncbi:MAG TPA: hypothetical protein VFW00_04725, partial [Rhodocyclaceae bacterium]|nr:hypothetical protein [Rhodocyclaceae bacterium]